MASRITPMTRSINGRHAPEMNLPEGSTCADCRHFARCEAIFGHIATDEVCDWSPSRFSPAERATVSAALAKEFAAGEAVDLAPCYALTHDEALVAITALTDFANSLGDVERAQVDQLRERLQLARDTAAGSAS